MTSTDKDIDEGLRQLASMAPRDSVWSAIEQELFAHPEQPRAARQKLRGAPLGSGLLALSAVIATLVLFDFPAGLLPFRDAASTPAPTVQASVAALNNDAETAGVDLSAARPVRGRYVRYLYNADEALLDAMLEEEIRLVDRAMLESSPREQRQLWRYRTELADALTGLRYQAVPEKYLF